MMLEAGSNPRLRNKGGLTAVQLVDPSNQALRELIQRHEYTSQNAGDYVSVVEDSNGTAAAGGAVLLPVEDESDEDAEFSGSDEEERAEWERRRKDKRKH